MGQGDMAGRIRAHDWAATPLGPIESWPQSLRTVVDLMLAARQPVYVAWGPDLTSLYNDAYILILGSKHPGALSKPYVELFAEIWDEYRPVVEATMAGEAQHFVDRPVTLAGRPGLPVGWFTFSWTPLRDEAGAVAGFYCAATETTEKVRTGEVLRAAQAAARQQNEERYHTLFQAIDAGFCVIEMLFDPHGAPCDYRFLEVNPAFERHTGLNGAVGRTVREMVPGHEAHWFEVYGHVALTGEPARFEHYAAGLDGRWFDVYAFRIGPPEERQVAVLFTDITARRRAEAALRESESRLAADLAGIRRLYDLHAKLASETDLHAALGEILAAAVEFVGTDRGTVQLVSGDGEHLEIVAHCGYGQDSGFTEYFRKGGCKAACDATRRGRQRLIIEDVETFPGIEGTKDRAVALADGIRAAQSTPMISRKGDLVGVLSTQFPRPHRPSEHELRLIDLLAWTAADFVERHRAGTALRESEARWRALFERMGEGFEVNEMVYGPDGRAVDFSYLEVNAAWERQTGMSRKDVLGRRAGELFPREEIAFWVDAFGRVAATDEAAHIERYFPPLNRWFEVIAYRLEPGRVAALVLDATERHRSEERQQLLMREVDHRAKNALAVVQSALHLTRAPDLPAYVRAVTGRVSALARAQTLLAKDRWHGADLRSLLEGELTPFVGADQQVVLDSPAVALPARAAQPLAMAAHELATNAVKYGALSVPTGRVSISWRLEGGSSGTLRLRWAETGGPPVAGPPSRRGFGSRVLEATVRGQLGGRVSLTWEPTGLACDIEVPLGRDPSSAKTAGGDVVATD